MRCTRSTTVPSDPRADGYTLTDPDTGQWCKARSDTAFLVIDGGVCYDIELADTDAPTLTRAIAGYYPSLDALRRAASSPRAANQLIAECIAEAGGAI